MSETQCPECGARYAHADDSCAVRFATLLALDHSRQEPWGIRHGQAFAAYALQHPLAFETSLDHAWAALHQIYVAGLDGGYVFSALRSAHGGRVPPGWAVPPRATGPVAPRVTIADLGDFAAAIYPAHLDAWCVATLEAWGHPSRDPSRASLLLCQRTALQHVQGAAGRLGAEARARIDGVLERHGLAKRVYDGAVEGLRAHARVALHFHPERLARGGVTVARGLLESGLYKNQFETGLSGGSPSAYAGGERDRWESRLFGGAYHVAGVAPNNRPKYGALQIIDHPDGPAPRFGSCYFLLRPSAAGRSSFTFGGSHEDGAVERTGTLDVFDIVMAPLLAQLEQGRGAFGVNDLTVPELLAEAGRAPSASRRDSARPLGRALDSFIEVQIHGDVSLDDDVERLVADPAFLKHPVRELLEAMSARYGIPLSWHPGFTLPVGEVPAVFRDFPVRRLAERIAGDGVLDAANIGVSANSLELEPAAWSGWAPYDEILTQFRRLWHVVVLNGSPRSRPMSEGQR